MKTAAKPTPIAILILIICYILYSSSLPAHEPAEAGIVTQVDREIDQAVKLLEKAVNINSGTMNFDGVRKVGSLFRHELDRLGFKTEWIDGTPFNRAGHLRARRNGGPLKLLLIGHLDTVFAEDSQFQRFQPLGENKVKGPGITDMKGGDVVMIYALRALAANDLLQNLSIEVIMTGDEEKRGAPIAVATEALIEGAKWADIAIGFEDGDGDPKTAVIARRGSSGWRLTVKGQPAHSSQIFRSDIGYGAIFETARILDQFRQNLSDETNLTFNPGAMVAGTEAELNDVSARGKAFGKKNVIPQIAIISGDIRTLSLEQLVRTQENMARIVAENLPGTTAEISFYNGYPPMAPSEGNLKLLKLFDQISKHLGYGPVIAVDPRRAGAADISFTAGHVKMAMDGIGLMGEGGHTDNEIADMETLAIQIKRSALLMYRLSQMDLDSLSQ